MFLGCGKIIQKWMRIRMSNIREEISIILFLCFLNKCSIIFLVTDKISIVYVNILIKKERK